MDKVKEIEASFNHGLSLAERKNVVVTGVKKIESFDSNEFMIDTTLGFLNIKGEELEIIKLDTYQGNVSIKGKVDALIYLDNNQKKDKESSFILKINYKFINKFNIVFNYIISFLFILAMSLLYFLILLKINNGYIHLYFYLCILFGYLTMYFIFKKWFT